MALFQVTDVINGNTIKVPGWKYGEDRGSLVKIFGYMVPFDPALTEYLKVKLTTLLKDKSVELRRVVAIEKINDENVLHCSVYLNEIDIATYFREFNAKTP
jgi:hypothetical protein